MKLKSLAMRKNITKITLLGGFALLIAGGMFFSSCEGPAGADGADGQNGQDGVDGVDGVDGADGTATCVLCHSDDQTIVTKTKQYENSAHYLGHTSGYTNRSFGPLYNCAGCHTSQGYLDNLVGASNTPYLNVTQPNCYTCHKIHDTYTEEDWALQQEGPLDPATGSPAFDLGSGNQCVACHQFAAQYLVGSPELFENFDDGGATTVEIDASKKRVGVHHAPQYNIVSGMDLFEFTGSTAYPTEASHVSKKAENGCVTCHMNDGFGDMTGHSMAMTYEFHGHDNHHWPASCTECHTEGAMDLTTIYETTATATDALLVQLYDLLVAAGIMNPADGPDEYLMAAGTWSTELTAAHVNYNAIREDRSHGFHHSAYITAVLENSIEAVSAK